MTISGRTIAMMIHYSGYNDVLRIYSTTERDGVDYNLAYIKPDFTVEHRTDFDSVYMPPLFDYSYQKAVRGCPSHKAPPIFAPPQG